MAEFDILRGLLPKRVKFRYFRDRYALLRLAEAAGERGVPVGALKRGPLAPLMDKPLVRALAARAADGVLTRDLLLSHAPPRGEVYRLTFDRWGSYRDWQSGWQQSSRPAVNLAVLVNFSRRHNRAFRASVGRVERDAFEFGCHPEAKAPELTLAWARLDLDFDTNEALIEEVQSDWVKLAAWRWDELRRIDPMRAGKTRRHRHGSRGMSRRMLRAYVERDLKPHAAMWDEATLSAALWTVCELIGIRRVFYHTYETGKLLKRISSDAPRSLYSDLPRRFCMRETSEGPQFLRRCRAPLVRETMRSENLRWFVLE